METEIKQKFNILRERFDKINNFDINALHENLEKLENELQTPAVWADKKRASELGAKVRDIKDNLEFVSKWSGILDDCQTAFELGD